MSTTAAEKIDYQEQAQAFMPEAVRGLKSTQDIEKLTKQLSIADADSKKLNAEIEQLSQERAAALASSPSMSARTIAAQNYEARLTEKKLLLSHALTAAEFVREALEEAKKQQETDIAALPEKIARLLRLNDKCRRLIFVAYPSLAGQMKELLEVLAASDEFRRLNYVNGVPDANGERLDKGSNRWVPDPLWQSVKLPAQQSSKVDWWGKKDGEESQLCYAKILTAVGFVV